MMEHKRIIQSCKVRLEPSDIRTAGEELARRTRELIKIVNDRKTAAASFNSLEKDQQTAIEQLSLQITQGYIYRDLECYVLLSTPAAGMKQIIRPDTNEVVSEVPMTAEEMQAGFNFDEGKKPQ